MSTVPNATAAAAADSQTVVTPEATACYAFVFEARPSMNPGGEPQFSITLVFPKTTDISKLRTAARTAARKKWGDKMPAGLRSPFRDGDSEREGDPVFAGSVFVTAKSKQRPGIVDQALRPIIDPMAFYSGCKCRASLYAFAYDTSGNKGVGFLLNNLQKLGDGDRLSGRRPAEADFEAVPMAEGAPAAAAGTAQMDDDIPF